jgi:hypothetical protein
MTGSGELGVFEVLLVRLDVTIKFLVKIQLKIPILVFFTKKNYSSFDVQI